MWRSWPSSPRLTSSAMTVPAGTEARETVRVNSRAVTWSRAGARAVNGDVASWGAGAAGPGDGAPGLSAGALPFLLAGRTAQTRWRLPWRVTTWQVFLVL